MTGLAKLLEMQRAKAAGAVTPHDTKEGLTGNADTHTSDATRDDAAPAMDSTVSPDSAIPQSIPAVAESAPAPAKAGGFKLNLAGKPAATPSGGSGGSQTNGVGLASRLAGLQGAKSRSDSTDGTKPAAGNRTAPDAGAIDSPDFSLADLATADVGDESSVIRDRSHFLDEVAADAPIRDLPEDLTVQQKQFIESLDGIYTVLDDPEMFGQIVRNVMIELTQNPEYIKLVQDQDIHTMIRAMRNTMGLARIKKTEAKAKRGSGAASRKKQTSESDMDMLSTLEGLAGFDGD